MAAHFGSMLLNRRRELGLSIQQVANVVKIRPQIIEYFETENFDAMPPRGYAQGMISSYARYLGLSPSDVVNAYYEDLHAFENAAPGTRAGRFQDPAADAHTRGSNDSGRYLMVEGGRKPTTTTTSRYGQRPPQAGYVSEASSDHTPVSASRLRHASIVNARDPQANGRPRESVRQQGGSQQAAGYGAAASSTTQMPAQGQSQGRGNATRSAQRDRGRSAQGRGRGTDGARTEQARQGQRAPRDARQGRGQGTDYERSRDGAYGQRAQQGRPARGNGGGYGGDGGRGGRGGGGRGGRGGRQGGFFSRIDPRILLAAIVVLLVLVVVLLVSTIRGCVSSSSDSSSTTPTTIISTGSTTVDEDDDSSEDDSSSDEDSDADSEDGTASDEDDTESSEDDTASEETVEETIVTISVADDAVAYIEVKLDGVTELGEDVVGPEELEYTVTEQIVITTDSPSDVKVYKNGEKVSYDIKTSGVAKVTISADTTSTSTDESEDEDSTEESA